MPKDKGYPKSDPRHKIKKEKPKPKVKKGEKKGKK